MSIPENGRLPRANGEIAPSFFDEAIGDFNVPRGKNGTPYMNQIGSVVEDYWEGSSPITKSFNTSMNGFSIANDGLEILTFTINGVTRTVYPGEPYNGILKPFRQVIINAKDKYRAEVLK